MAAYCSTYVEWMDGIWNRGRLYEATTLRLSSYTTDLALVGANWGDVAKDVGEISATDGLLALCGGCKVALGVRGRTCSAKFSECVLQQL